MRRPLDVVEFGYSMTANATMLVVVAVVVWQQPIELERLMRVSFEFVVNSVA